MRVVFIFLILFEAVNISAQTEQNKTLVSEIVFQLSLSDNIQANIFNGNYNSSDVRNVLKDNRINYKTFYFNLRSSVNEDFSNTVNYAYSRANFLFDEDEEVIYWLNEYSTYLKGLRNRISNDYSQPNYLAKNNFKDNSRKSKTNAKKNSLITVAKKRKPKKEILEKLIAEETTELNKIKSLEEIIEKPVAEETASKISSKVQETIIEETTTDNSIDSTEEVISEAINEIIKEVKDSTIIELPENKAIETQENIIEETKPENRPEIAKEIVRESINIELPENKAIETQENIIEETKPENRPEIAEEIVRESINIELPENKAIETQETLIKETENSTEIVGEIVQEPNEENRIETQETIIKETTANNSIDLNKDVIHEIIQEIEAPIVDNLNKENNIEKTTTNNNTKTKELEDNKVQRSTIIESTEENIIVIQETKIEETKSENTDKINKEIVKETIAVVTPEESTPKKEQPIKNNESNFGLSYSAKLENELANKAVLYYTVRVKSVSNPADGLKFLSEIKDNDAVWDEHTFHLFKDQEKENITNISIGKFVNKEDAEELMAYLKTKNITNPSIEIHENNVKSIVRNVQPKSKPINTTNPRTAIENPVNKIVKSPETKKEVSSNKNLLDNISTKVDESENYFSVQVGANNKISSTNIQGLNLNKEKLFFVNIEQGKYAMNYGKHNDYGSAHKIALEIHKKGLETAFVTKYENGVRVKITKNDYLSDKTPKKTISDDINQLGYIPIGPNDKGKFIQIGTIYNWDAHNFKSLYDQLERTIYYKIKENNSVIFLVGPLQENEVFIELRNVKQVISDAFIKTI